MCGITVTGNSASAALGVDKNKNKGQRLGKQIK
jgi:hypothetical protein